ncbi:ROK family protein [Saliterribacillus persicus]|uniref:Beta-glucoside kinase n=1 Tax=Saliterribacillus persicus TaxID=930114 RepID=A0A368Y7H5_9BACI|nr:ROK family protein [Saliterribacillus persicus]RCW74767.1 beta-glucoside kinase [Saliterribacillus persicus]
MESQYLCMDVGGTNVKYGVLKEDGTVVTRNQYRTRKNNAKEFIQDMTDIILKLQEEYTIQKVGISFPGFINPTTGYAEFAGAIDVLHHTNLLDLLKEKISLSIIIENDANCATLAEKHSGNAVNCTDFICMTIGTGIGGGLFVNGSIVTGYNFKAGEFGLMIVNGMKNGYENMHDIASTSAFIRRYKEIKQISTDTHIEGSLIFDEAKSDPEVNQMLEEWFSYLSFGIFNLVATFNPEKILIGGAISERSDLYERLELALLKIPSWEDVRTALEPCKYHNDAGMIGALYQCLKH